MFCTKCGQQIPDDAQFCSHCGASLNGTNPNQNPGSGAGMKVIVIVLAAIAVLLVAVVGILLAAGNDKEEPVVTVPETTAALVQEETVQTLPPETTSAAAPEGWYEEGGETYFFEDGQYYVGIWEIDGAYYYFDEDGAMMRSTTAEDEDGFKFKLGSNGQMTDICYPSYGGQWAAKSYKHGNGGQSSVMEYVTPIENCTSVDLYVEAEGNYGANVNGNWKVHFKIDGKWKELTSFSYSGSSTTTHIEFPSPVTIEAITAYPTKQGNASYSCLYRLQNVWCEF